MSKAPDRGVDHELDTMVDKCLELMAAADMTPSEQEVRDALYARLVEFGGYQKKEGQDGSENSEPGV
jgi:hypothetical protein